MSENLTLHRASQSLIEKVTETIEHFESEMRKAADKLSEFQDKKQILEVAVTKTNSGMAQSMIKDMIDELEKELERQGNSHFDCKNNRDYYKEILKAINEAVNSI